MARRTGIAVVGCGVVTPFAAGVGRDVLRAEAATLCRSGDSYWAVPDDFLQRFESFPAELKRERGAWITAGALSHACEDAAVKLADFPAERIALVVGSALAGQIGMINFAEEVRAQSARFVSPIHFPQTVGNYVAGALSRAFDIQGPNLTISNGAASGLLAISTACDLLADGAADTALAGGTEVLSDVLVRSLGGSEFGDTNAGVWSEGACMYVLRPAGAAEAPPLAIIREWTTTGSRSAPAEEGSVAHFVGKSLAAESAMRLGAAVYFGGAPQQRLSQHGEDGAATELMVERAESI